VPAAETVKVLLIEDNRGDARLMEAMLAEAGDAQFELETADRLSSGLARLAKGGVDVVLLDLGLPDSWGFDSFTGVYNRAPDVPIIVLSGLGDRKLAMRAVQEGAQGYLIKGQLDAQLLMRAIRHAIGYRREKKAA